jgi:inosine/xanthosine triphosphatase
MRIAIGSLNPVKREAAEAALTPLFPAATFLALDVPSGIPAQPWGDEQTRNGALNRARAAMQQTGADWAVGLEGGLKQTDVGLMTCAWAAVVSADGRQGVGGGANMLIPPALTASLAPGQELGPVMDELTGEHNTNQALGAIGFLTDGLETRQSAFVHVLHLALAPFRRPDLYL